MRKLIESIIIIVSTIITVFFMNIISNTIDNTADIKSDKIVKNSYNEDLNYNKENIDSNKKNTIDNNIKVNKEKNKISIEKNNEYKNKEKINKNLENYNRENSILNNIETNKSKETVKKDIKEDIGVFKVNKNRLQDKISFKDKKQLLYLSTKLNGKDIKNIINYMKSDNELWAATNIFKTLKEKLSIKDYEKIKEILSPYMEIDNIEKNII
ncbi:hypothetical protein [Clostridium fallax]|uniref:DUF4476 domain-containing protein n=1 Tax=Clostridium fallax TaxID=1533 RepID=A0A1M4VEA3_9CLOT|nr:hypothetical protein [Clostridium fallax]SHE67331.1 hypothetical protein SAMN05443638_107103 [Clostridium fallax]SQB05757.1 Uncharacterised protein [Clostridium fallax]